MCACVCGTCVCLVGVHVNEFTRVCVHVPLGSCAHVGVSTCTCVCVCFGVGVCVDVVVHCGNVFSLALRSLGSVLSLGPSDTDVARGSGGRSLRDGPTPPRTPSPSLRLGPVWTLYSGGCRSEGLVPHPTSDGTGPRRVKSWLPRSHCPGVRGPVFLESKGWRDLDPNPGSTGRSTVPGSQGSDTVVPTRGLDVVVGRGGFRGSGSEGDPAHGWEVSRPSLLV